MEKQKKQIDLLEARVQELKKVAASKEVEVKDLRLKLKSTEHDRLQLAAKQGEAVEAKKSLESQEFKRKEELRERDKRVADLERDLASERKKRELAERKAKDSEEKGAAEVAKVRSEMKKVEAKFSSSSQDALKEAQEQAEEREQTLLTQLEHHRELVQRVAKEYGRLASQSIPLSTHQRLKDDHTKLKLRGLTLERRLLNSESQVTELAYLIRQTKEKNLFLQTELHEMENVLPLYHSALEESSSLSTSLASEITLHQAANAAAAAFSQDKHDQLYATNGVLDSLFNISRLTCRNLFYDSLAFDAQLREEQLISRSHATSYSSTKSALEATTAQLRGIQDEKGPLERQLETATGELIALKASTESMSRHAKEMEEKMVKANERCEVAVKKEKTILKECTATIQKSKMAEEALRSEIDEYVLSFIHAFIHFGNLIHTHSFLPA